MASLFPLPPANAEVPYGGGYHALNFTENGFNQWPMLVRIVTLGDGSCLLHAIVNGYYLPYRTSTDKQQVLQSLISTLRKEMSQKLSAIDPCDDEGKFTYYQTINNGYLPQGSKEIPEFTLDNMVRCLDSHQTLGTGYLDLISRLLNRDLYIISERTQDLYVTDELPYIITGKRSAVIVYWDGFNHYELVALKNSQGTFDTHFKASNPLIEFLYSRYLNITARSSSAIPVASVVNKT